MAFTGEHNPAISLNGFREEPPGCGASIFVGSIGMLRLITLLVVIGVCTYANAQSDGEDYRQTLLAVEENKLLMLSASQDMFVELLRENILIGYASGLNKPIGAQDQRTLTATNARLGQLYYKLQRQIDSRLSVKAPMDWPKLREMLEASYSKYQEEYHSNAVYLMKDQPNTEFVFARSARQELLNCLHDITSTISNEHLDNRLIDHARFLEIARVVSEKHALYAKIFASRSYMDFDQEVSVWDAGAEAIWQEIRDQYSNSYSSGWSNQRIGYDYIRFNWRNLKELVRVTDFHQIYDTLTTPHEDAPKDINDIKLEYLEKLAEGARNSWKREEERYFHVWISNGQEFLNPLSKHMNAHIAMYMENCLPCQTHSDLNRFVRSGDN